MPITNAGHLMGLRRAAAIIASAAKRITEAGRPGGKPSKKIPPTIVSGLAGEIGFVNAGGPGGRTAPNAYMFETRGARHPLFAHGPRGTDGWLHWYTQPYWPFLEEAADVAGQEAADVYADTAIGEWCRESGWK